MKKYEISYNKGGAAAAPSTGPSTEPSIESKQQPSPDDQRRIDKENNEKRNFDLIEKLLWNQPRDSPKHLIIGMSEDDILFKLPEKGIYTPIIFEYFDKKYGQYLSKSKSYNTYKDKSFDVIFIDAFLHAYDKNKTETDSYRKPGWQNAQYLIKLNSILKDDGILCLPFFPSSLKKNFRDPLNGHNRRAFINLFVPVNPSKTIRDPYLRSNPHSMIPTYPGNIAWKCYTKFNKSTGVTGPGGTIFYPEINTVDRGAFEGFVL